MSKSTVTSRLFSLGSYTRRKPVEKSLSEENNERTLTWVDLTLYGIAATVGSGVYATVGEVASGYYDSTAKHGAATGPAVVLSTLVAAGLSLLTSICYLEFASALPISGSGYAYFYSMIGEFLGWFIGWNLTLEYAFAAAALAGKWSDSLKNLLPRELSSNLLFIFNYELSSVYPQFRLNVIAALLVLGVGLFVRQGVKMGARFTNAATVMNLTLILFVIVVGASQVKIANWTPFIAEMKEKGTAKSAVSRIVGGGAYMFFCFIGYDTVSTLSADAINPARDIPIAAFLTIGTAAALYSAVGLILTGMVPWQDIAKEAPLASAFETVKLGWAKYIVNGFSLVNIAITVFACLMGQPKIFAAIARDGLLPQSLAVENSNGVASGALMLAVCGTALISGFYDVQSGLIDMISAGCLFSMAAVCAGMLAARYTSAPAELKARGNGAVVAFFLTALVYCLLLVKEFSFFWISVSGVSCLVPFAILVWQFVQYPMALRPNSAVQNAFVCPFMPWLPCIAVLANFYVLASIDWYSLGLFAGWAALGVTMYLGYGLHHSRLGIEMESVKEFGKF